MDLSKRYKDSGDNPRNILEMVEREPDWAANRIQAGEAAISEAERLEKLYVAECNKLRDALAEAEKALNTASNKIAELTDTLAAVMAPEWRPVTTLPKIIGAGRSLHVLGAIPFDGTHLMRVCYYCSDGWIDARSLAVMSPPPTHWQPLPEPPVAESV